MRYKATPQGQTASYSILLCHQEETQGKEKRYSLKTKLLCQPSPIPECYSIIHQHNRNTEMIDVVTALLTGQKEIQLHFIQQYLKSAGRKRLFLHPLCL